MTPENPPLDPVIAGWLRSLGLEQYTAAFESNHITFELLESLDDAALRDCGVQSVGHRRTMLAAIKLLSSSSGVRKPAPRPPAPAVAPAPVEPVAQVVPVAPVVPRKAATAEPALARPVPLAEPAPVALAASGDERETDDPGVTAEPLAAGVARDEERPVGPPLTGWGKFLRMYRNASGGSLLLSIGLHSIILLIGTWLVVSSIVEERKLSFGGGAEGERSEVQHKVQMKRKTTTAAPAPAKRITTTSNLARVALPDMPDMPTSMGPTIAGAIGAGGFGAGGGLGGGGGGGGGGSGRGVGSGFSNINFFGFRSNGRHLAFLVDYSQSMSGPFRQAMERKLEASLKELPPGTQMLIIPWAGGAWLHNQRAPQIKARGIWIKGSNYDDFRIAPGKKLDPPVWTAINLGSIEGLVRGVKAQEDWPGGTDWLSPIAYALSARPLPDAIFIMSDGQVVSEANYKRKLDQIEAVMKNSPKRVPINALWIENENGMYRRAMRELASRFKGEFKVIGADGQVK
jgi:hypothetical protein